jgi:alkylated DNA repair dioxygenase AlkB
MTLFTTPHVLLQMEYKVITLPLLHPTVEYTSNFLSNDEAQKLYQWCVDTLPFEQHHIKMFGKTVKQPRLTCMVGVAKYSYSGSSLKGIPMPDELKEIIDKIQLFLPDTHPRPNAVLCNYYKDGNNYIAPHSDTEVGLYPNTTICSLSLGATRTFEFIPKDAAEPGKTRIDLGSGSMVFMHPGTQLWYKHTVPKQPSIKEGRVNLTFRCAKE